MLFLEVSRLRFLWRVGKTGGVIPSSDTLVFSNRSIITQTALLLCAQISVQREHCGPQRGLQAGSPHPQSPDSQDHISHGNAVCLLHQCILGGHESTLPLQHLNLKDKSAVSPPVLMKWQLVPNCLTGLIMFWRLLEKHLLSASYNLQLLYFTITFIKTVRNALHSLRVKEAVFKRQPFKT